MDKMGYARGLVKYSTQNAVNQHWTKGQMLRHVLRPRVLIYSAVLGAVVLATLVSLTLRTPFKVDVVRDRGVMARMVEGGRIENVYRLQIMNATEQPQRYSISATGLEGLAVLPAEPVLVDAAQSRWVAVRLQVPYGSAAAGSHPVHFDVRSADGRSQVSEKAAFLVPR
jgi:polyferredoxin